MSIFRAYDVRGVVGETLTTDIVTQVGHAVGSEAAARGLSTVVVGRDGRLSGPTLQEALVKGLHLAGRHVIDLGAVPTPVLYFATYHLNTGTGVMVTGSHNPPNYNGLKMMIGGDTLAGEAIQALKRRIDTEDLLSCEEESHYERFDISQAYIERIVQDVKLARPFKVVIDCGNGVAGVIAPELMRRLGCQVIELFCQIDGRFPNHHPDPSQPENLHDLIQAVRTHQADIGLAFDGDADRLGIVDSNGNIIWPDRQMILFSVDILKRHPQAKIIFDVKCSRHLMSAIQHHNGQAIMWKTGHSFIKSKIKETGALLGGEMSGHIFFKERWYGFDDAIYAGARLLEILSKEARTVAEVFAHIPDAVSTPELKLETREGENFALMQQILETFHFEEAHISMIDGLRVDFKDGFGLVRPSNTTPCLVIRFEADSQQSLERIQASFRRQFLAIDNRLKLPF